MTNCISIIKAKEGCMDQLLEKIHSIVDQTRSEEGIIYYNALKPVTDPNTVILVDKWDKDENFDAHVSNAKHENSVGYEFSKALETFAETVTVYPCDTLY